MSGSTATFPKVLTHTSISLICDCPQNKATHSSACALSFFHYTTVFSKSQAECPCVCFDCKCLCFALKKRIALSSQAFFFMGCSSITSVLLCPGRLTSLGLSCDMKQFQNRNIFLVKLSSSPQPLLFNSPAAFHSFGVFEHVNSRVNNLFFILVGFFYIFYTQLMAKL